MHPKRSLFAVLAVLLLSTTLSAVAPQDRQRKTRVLDVVFAPVADPVGSKFIVDVGTNFVNLPPVPPFPGFPAGSHFLFTSVVYPGYTFPTTGPFANPFSLISPEKILGSWSCNGVFIEDTQIFTPGPEGRTIANATWALVLDTGLPNIDPRSVQNIFSSYSGVSIDQSQAGTGRLARLEITPITGATGLNADLCGLAAIKLYLDASGNILQRFIFEEPVILPNF
jgi:hypothetical protein